LSPDTSTPRHPDRIDKVGEELRAPRAAGVAGLLFAILFITSLLLVSPPQDLSSGQAVADWYTSRDIHTRIIIMGLYTIPFSGIAFLWFIGVVRDRIGEMEDRLFATVFLGSGLLFVAMLFSAAGIVSAMALRFDALGAVGKIDPAQAQFMQALTAAFLYVYAARAAGVFMIVTSTITIRTRTVPKWVAIVGYAIALLLLLSIRSFHLIMLLFPAWVALLSIFILITPPPGPGAELLTGAGANEPGTNA